MFHFFVVIIINNYLKEGRSHITLRHATMLPLGLGNLKVRLLESSIIFYCPLMSPCSTQSLQYYF